MINDELEVISAGKDDMRSALLERNIQMSDDRLDSYPGYIDQIRDISKQTLSISDSGTYTAPEESGYNQVIVKNDKVGEGESLGVEEVFTENGEYSAPDGEAYNKITVKVPEWNEIEYLADTWNPTLSIMPDKKTIIKDAFRPLYSLRIDFSRMVYGEYIPVPREEFGV